MRPAGYAPSRFVGATSAEVPRTAAEAVTRTPAAGLPRSRVPSSLPPYPVLILQPLLPPPTCPARILLYFRRYLMFRN